VIDAPPWGGRDRRTQLVAKPHDNLECKTLVADKPSLIIESDATSRDITITSEHILDLLNMIADQESRQMIDRTDWMLNQSVFKKIERKWRRSTYICLPPD
jgi:hypothetical protein